MGRTHLSSPSLSYFKVGRWIWRTLTVKLCFCECDTGTRDQKATELWWAVSSHPPILQASLQLEPVSSSCLKADWISFIKYLTVNTYSDLWIFLLFYLFNQSNCRVHGCWVFFFSFFTHCNYSFVLSFHTTQMQFRFIRSIIERSLRGQHPI